MAKFAYDVNTRRRLIDVHKQFRGGLKTVDTDDSLGAVFLRQAENVSLSEFGFIEKRYGTFEKFKAGLTVDTTSNLQGYWEFLGKYIIVALNGKIYHQLLTTPESSFTEITQFHTKSDLIYPSNLATYLGLESDFSVGSGFSGFQTTRPMGAVNVSNVLYLFTGKYPIYLAEEEGVLKAYLFAKETPSYAEIVVTGHNLLENDYTKLYYDAITDPQSIGFLNEENDYSEKDIEKQFIIKDATFSPAIAFAKDGEINFRMSYDYDSELAKPIEIDDTNQPPAYLNSLNLTKISARPSGPGATDLSFTDFNLSEAEFNQLNNVPDGIDTEINIAQSPITNFDDVNIVTTGGTPNTTITSTGSHTVKETYWAWDNNSQIRFGLYPSGDNLFKVDYKQISVDIDDIPTANFVPNTTIAISLHENTYNTKLDLENKLIDARSQINSFSLNDSRSIVFKPICRAYYVDLGATTPEYAGKEWVLFADFGGYQYPIWFFKSPKHLTDHRTFGGTETLEVSFTGTSNDLIKVVAKEGNGDIVTNQIVQYHPDLSERETVSLQYSELTKALPMTRANRTAFNTMRTAVNKGTIIEVYVHKNNTDELFKSYTVGKDPEVKFEKGNYSLKIPSDITTSGVNHYRLVFKTVDVNISQTEDQSTYLAQGAPASLGSAFWFGGQLQFFESINDDLRKRKLLYPNLSQFSRVAPTIYEGFDDNKLFYDLFPIATVLALQSEDEFGTAFLNVKVNKGLLSGTYDFRFEYNLLQQRINYTTSTPDNVVDAKVVSFIVKDVPITEEKLTDYTFFEGDKAHPIWSCNQVIDHFNKLMVYGSEEMPTALFYSFPDRPFYFPSKFYLEFTNDENLPINSVSPYSKILVVQTETQTWGVKGNSGLVDAPSPYIQFSINSTVGTIAPTSVRPVRNRLFFLSKQGIVALNSLYAVDESYNIDFVDRNIRNIVPQDSKAIGIQFDNQYWLNFPNSGITLRWYIDKKAWVQDKYNGWSDLNGTFKWIIRNGKLEFITYPSVYDGGVYIYNIGVDYKLPTDISTPIVAKFETSFLNQNYPFHPKNYKEAKLDFTLQNEYNQSKDSLYTMTSNEDISSESVHFIDNVAADPNHFYKVQYDFDPLFNELDAGTFISSFENTYDGGDFSTNSYNTIGNLVFSVAVSLDAGTFGTALTDIYDGGNFSAHPSDRVILDGFEVFVTIQPIDASFNHLEISSVKVTQYDDPNIAYDIPFTISDDFVSFQMPNAITGNQFDIQIIGNFKNYIGGADVKDITYDDSLTFKAWVISEEKTLNLDNINSYDQAKADVKFNLNNRLGTWVFGTSDFGKTVTAVKTIKLSGKGYNSKIYMEDYSKSKWTLESMGITYKMKRARSR